MIDSRSDDGTEEAARERCAGSSLPIVEAEARAPYGLRHRPQARDDIVVTMDADGQHQPELPTVVGPIIDGRADHVNGSRMLSDFERETLIRHLGVHFFSRVGRS